MPPAFLDANVLYSRTICDWLFLLADEARGRMPPLVSSEDCLTEALYRFRRNNPTVDGDRIARKRAMLTAALDDVIESYSGSTPFPGSDEHDTHVHAAVLACNAGYLVTDDAGFGRIEPDLLPYEVHTSDSFLLLIEEDHPQMVDRVIIRMVGYRNDRGERSNLVESLTTAACPRFAAVIAAHLRHATFGPSGLRLGEAYHPEE